MLLLPGVSTYRVAVVVSKKVHKSAVVRNRIRRRLFEVTRRYFAASGGKPDLVFVVQSATLAALPAEQFEAEVTSLLQKIPQSS